MEAIIQDDKVYAAFQKYCYSYNKDGKYHQCKCAHCSLWVQDRVCCVRCRLLWLQCAADLVLVAAIFWAKPGNRKLLLQLSTCSSAAVAGWTSTISPPSWRRRAATSRPTARAAWYASCSLYLLLQTLLQLPLHTFIVPFQNEETVGWNGVANG